MELTPLQLYILLHLKKANVEYAKMISKMTEINLAEIQESLDYLLSIGLIERDKGSAIKRTRARFKRAAEVHKHHTYYKLSKRGVLLVRKIDREFLRRYFTELLGEQGYELFLKLISARNFEEACRDFSNCQKIRENFMELHFITPKGNKTTFFKRFVLFAQL